MLGPSGLLPVCQLGSRAPSWPAAHPPPAGTAAPASALCLLAECSLLPLPPPSPPGPPGRTCTAGHSPHLRQAQARYQLAPPWHGLARAGAEPPASRRELGAWAGPGSLGQAGAPGGLLRLLRGGFFALQRTRMLAALRALSWTPKEHSVWVSSSLSPEGGRGPGSHAPRSLPTQRAQPQPLLPRLPHCTRPLLSVLPSRLCPARCVVPAGGPWAQDTGRGSVPGDSLFLEVPTPCPPVP